MLIALVLAAIGAAGCGGSGSANDPSGGYFSATSVAGVDGDNPSIGDPGSIRVSFSDAGDGASWTAGCNEYWATATIKPSRIETEPAGGTEIGCQPGKQAEEEWLLDFMREGPEWQLDGAKLTLSTDRAAIELERINDPE
jgi:heat shock protein HslJ